MMRDLYSNISAVQAIAPAVQTDDVDSDAIDLNGSKAVAFIVNTGAIAGDGDFGVEVEESDASNSGFTAADAAFVDTDAPDTLEENSTYRLGYRGNKRYVRLALTKAGGTSLALGAVAVLDPLDRPVA